LKGKKSNLNRNILIGYFGTDRCNLTDKVVETTFDSIQKAISSWFDLIEISFLSEEMRDKYRDLLQQRIDILGLERSK
jgi:serine/threonine-protein kinase HipA